MTRQLDVDRVLEDWLAQGPSQLPERAIQETIGRLDSVRQRKPSWLLGSERMNRLVLAASAIAAAVIVAVVAIGPVNRDRDIGGPPGVAFRSERHGYTVVLPADRWYREERPGTWELGEFFDANSDSGVDYFEDQVSTLGPPPTWYVYLASQAIPEGMGFEAWAALHDAATDQEVPCFQQLGNYERRPVGGETARIGTYRCEEFGEQLVPWTTVQILVAHRGRGYAIYVWPVEMGPEMPPVTDIQAFANDWLARLSFDD
jgi:hypothetical protein